MVDAITSSSQNLKVNNQHEQTVRAIEATARPEETKDDRDKDRHLDRVEAMAGDCQGEQGFHHLMTKLNSKLQQYNQNLSLCLDGSNADKPVKIVDNGTGNILREMNVNELLSLARRLHEHGAVGIILNTQS